MVGLMLAVFAGMAFGHGGFDERLAQLAAELEKTPTDARLHFELADVNCQHGDWQISLLNLDRVDQLAPGRYLTDLLRGEAWLAGHQPAKAKQAFDTLLVAHPECGRAWLLRARATRQLGDARGSLADYREALRRTAVWEPDLVRETADALAGDGRTKEAAQILAVGISRLGDVPSLVRRSLELELATKDYDAALRRVEDAQRTAPRPEPWMARRASVLAQAGRIKESRAAWQALVDHLAALPNLERGSHAMSQLAETARQALDALRGRVPAPLREATAPSALPLAVGINIDGASAAGAVTPILVGPAGSGAQTFDTLPAANQWSTLSVAGAAGDVEGDAALDAAVNGIAADSIGNTLPSQVGSGTNGNAYWRSGDQKLGTQPSGNKMTLLMATLQNDSGSTLDALTVSYTLGLHGITPGESLKGHRLYWSKTGATGSWTAAGDFLLTTAGSTTNVNAVLTSLAWAHAGMLYVVWVDDNGSTNPDGDYTIDGVSFTPFSGPAATITSPGNSTTVGANFAIEATATTTSGTITSVSFYDGPTLLGTDNTSPYSYASIGAALGSHALTAVAVDSNNLSATSPVVNVTTVAGAGSLTRGPYLQKAAPTQMTIRWRNTLYNLGRVRYGASVGNLNQSVDETTAPAAQFNHVVTLAGLTPGTTYYYSVGSGSDTLASGSDYTFTTPPIAGTVTNTRVWVLGDAGTSGNSATPNVNQTAVRDAFYSWTGARTPNLVLQLGDNAYDSGTDGEFQKGMFDIYPTMLRKTPFWSCLGNHETGQATAFVDTYPYFDIYTLPSSGESGGVASGTEHYYSFDYGNIHFISLDSMTADRSPAGAMAVWLQADLASTTATWIVCFFHHPPYTKGSHDSDAETELVEMRSNFLPILEAGGVDLVLTGHSHCYERSYLLDGHYDDSSTLTVAMKKNAGDGRPAGSGAYLKPLTGPRDHFGAVYAVAGSAGKTSGGSLDHPAHFVSLSDLGSLVLDVNGSRLDATFLDENSSTSDTFTIIKQGAADTDSDGIPDEYEIAHGLDRFSAADALLDSDGDGVSNLKEFIFATASNVSDRYAFTTTYDSLAGTATVTFPTITGRTYRVWFSPDLLSWQPASAVVAGTGATMMWTDDGTATGTLPSAAAKRFYAIKVTVVP